MRTVLQHLQELERRTDDLCQALHIDIHLEKRGLRLAKRGEQCHKTIVRLPGSSQVLQVHVRPLPLKESQCQTRVLTRSAR